MKKILGYADCWSLTPGATVRFKVSTYGPSRYRADLVRVICGDSEPEHGVFHEEEMDAPFNGDYDGRFQPIDAGSYAVVEDSMALQALESFTRALEANPRSQLAHYNLAILFADSGIYREAIAEWQAAVEIDPDSDLGTRSRDNIEIIRQMQEAEMPDLGSEE